MAAKWPDWRVTESDDRAAVWIGHLRPAKTTYRIRMFYRVPRLLERTTVKQAQPRVYVERPELQRKPGNPEGDLPHVYWINGDRPQGEACLCLFDPDHEWSICDWLADTTVPWTSTWLYWYEAWLVTGIWFGPGRHDGDFTDVGRKGLETEEV
ncbi:hypothetical protein [Rhizobium mongolense]|uniref:Type II CBASS E2 protein domain-containing protein n=1 Tax=Rhizobium mongolense TaxID=57676 RepID=A0A7W6RKG7_9HYPH|nr:hypothetical protein [Rhizobium mongolense]MBB4274138.1 hypothetical protein [Rhizobium mongolense]